MPRPSSPVHAKASTKCSYLTLENPHHQRQPCIEVALSNPCGAHSPKENAYRCGRLISARFTSVCCASSCAHYVSRHDAPRHRLKNPFTMSKKCRADPRVTGLSRPEPLSSSLEYKRLSIPSALSQRWPGLFARRGNKFLIPLEQALVEPIGIEPMT